MRVRNVEKLYEHVNPAQANTLSLILLLVLLVFAYWILNAILA